MLRFCTLLCLFAVYASTISLNAQSVYSKCMSIAKQYEVPVMEKPAWAERQDKPIFTVAWLSDLHIRESKSLVLVTAALNTVRDTIKPNFTLITGDNSGYCANMSESEQKLPVSHQRQLWLKRFLEAELATPYIIIPGDNWPWYFEKVFGSSHRSFDFGGFHFMLTSTDVQATGIEGCAIFNNQTWEWMQNDLDANGDKPCFFIMHETLWPPFFLESGKTGLMLNARPQVLAALSGHLHLDLDFERGHWRQIVAPAIGRSHRPGFKHINFYKDAIILESYEWNADAKIFRQVNKWQRIEIPEKFREKLGDTPLAGFSPVNADALPPAAKVVDQKLRDRSPELSNALLGFAFSFGINRLLNK